MKLRYGVQLRSCLFRVIGLWIGLSILSPAVLTAIESTSTTSPQYLSSEALEKSLIQLERHRMRAHNQGILVETLDGQKVLADHNSDEGFNPASVMKLATSFYALSSLGPERRFQTKVYGDLPLNGKTKTLPGNLYIVSDGDPSLRSSDALALGRSLMHRGLRRVDGDLLIIGPFSLYSDRCPVSNSGDLLRRSLTRVGILIKGKVRFVSAEDVDFSSMMLFLKRESDRLRDILWMQNAHSINEIADQLGDILGGPEALEQFLIEEVGIAPDEIHVDRPSGLQFNKMTPRAAVKILRSLNAWLVAHNMKMQDIMPLAGVDEGTLFGRFRDPQLYGAILGKTGTNPVKDGGVSALAGMAFTRDQGPVLYAIFNSHGSVAAYRRWQDRFLKELIEENGGPGDLLFLRSESSPIGDACYWAPSEYWSSLEEDNFRQPNPKKGRSSSRKYSRSHRSSSHRVGN